MTEEQLTLDQMQKELREMPSSPQRLRLCQEFVALADREQARAQQISGRYDLAWAYATAGDPAKALPVCAEFLQMQKETPNTSGKPHWEAVLAVNIECLACDLACDLPQIPLEQCDALLMEFRRQVRTHGIGERLWQSYAGKVAAMTGDLQGAGGPSQPLPGGPPGRHLRLRGLRGRADGEIYAGPGTEG